MTSQALLLLEEFSQRAGLDGVPYSPDIYTGLVIDDLLIVFDISGSTLTLLSTIAIPARREADVLADAVAHNEGRAENKGAVVGYDEDGFLTVHDDIDVTGMHFPEFEQRMTEFVDLCERLGKPAPAEPEGEPAPHFAIYG